MKPYRILSMDTVLSCPVDMASYKSIPVLLKAADEADLSSVIPWLEKNFL